MDTQKEILKAGFHSFYKEVTLLKDFVRINNDGFRKILKKHQKVMKQFSYNDLQDKMERRQNESTTSRNLQKVGKLLKEVEDYYLDFFFPGHLKKDGREKLRLIVANQMISQKETFVFGLFLGFSIIFFTWIIILFSTAKLDADYDILFHDIFPIFRGAALMVSAIWMISLNVYVWTKFHVNYKHVFKFRYHFSQISQILKRAAIFTMIFLVMFIWYVILKDNSLLAPALNWLPKDYTGIIVWVAFFAYMFCPFKDWFNYEGRVYTFELLRKCVISPFVEMEFRMAWLTDQFISLSGALRDFQYTICYTFNKITTDDISTCKR